MVVYVFDVDMVSNIFQILFAHKTYAQHHMHFSKFFLDGREFGWKHSIAKGLKILMRKPFI